MAWNPLSRFGRSEPPPPAENTITLPDRQCGGCTECCVVPTIEDLKKPAGIVCVHCETGAGCRIYDQRPPVCRSFLCGWRQLAVLDDEWRPDRCGIIVSFTNQYVPPAYAHHTAIQFELFRDAQSAITWQPFVNYVTELIRNGLPVFLQVPAEPGFEPSRLFLNDVMITSVALRDYGRVILDLTRALTVCESIEKKPVALN